MIKLFRDYKVWSHLAILSLVSFSGMAVLMSTIIWQMHGSVVKERKERIQSHVIAASKLTEKVYADYKQNNMPNSEAQQKVLAYLSAIKYPDNGYFWVIDSKGLMLMHPYDRQLVGKPTFDLQDKRGRYFVREFLNTASLGGGFVSYTWSRPSGGEPAPKISYVKPFKEWNWVIGSGLYVDDLRENTLQNISVGGTLIFILFGVNAAILLYLSRRYINEFRNTAIHDSLTGLFTRRYLDEIGDKMMRRSEMEIKRRKLAAIFLDIDHFKQVNDAYGHKTGDMILSKVGEIIKNSLRPNELAFRYGGEEMVLLLHASEKNCHSIAERIRTSVTNYKFKADKDIITVRLSAGIAIGRRNESLSSLLRRADRCLYIAKQQGRDRTVLESEVTESI